MDSDKILEFKEDFSLLIEAGFVAVKQLDETSSIRIFQAAQALSPQSTAPQIGMGYIALNKLDVDYCLFQKALCDGLNKNYKENFHYNHNEMGLYLEID